MEREIELFLRHLRGQGRSHTTVTAYQSDLRQFRAHCQTMGVEHLRQINYDHVSDWFATLRDNNRTPNTIVRKNAALRTFFAWAASRGVAFVAGAAPVIRRDRHQIPYVPTPADIEAILDACDQQRYRLMALRDRALILFLWSTGCRRAEALALNVQDLQLEAGADGQVRGSARVRGKGRKQRIVFLGERAAAALQAYIPYRLPYAGQDNADALFLSRQGTRMDHKNASSIVSQHARRAGIQHRLTCHSLRHAFATQMLRGGADLHTLSRMLGHQSLSTTDVYLHYDPDRARQIHAALDPSRAPQGR